MRRLLPILLLAMLVTPAFAMRHKHAHKHRGKWNVLFWPTRLSQLRQNREIDQDGLERLKNQRELDELVANGELVPVRTGRALIIDPKLDPKRRYCRPWTMDFLSDISEKFYTEFHEPLMVDSAVRTVEYQRKLRRRNKNAAPETGEVASSHLAGLTVDLARRRMSPRQVKWIELQLLVMHAKGWVEVEEEHHQLCFHIMVARSYGELP